MKFYLLVVWNDIEPEILGPFASEESRLAAARNIRREDPNKDHGVYRLEAEGNVVVGEFTGGVLGDGKIQPGDEVYWHDPDNGIASGYGVIIDIHSDIVTLKMHSGSEVEAFCHELDLCAKSEEK